MQYNLVLTLRVVDLSVLRPGTHAVVLIHLVVLSGVFDAPSIFGEVGTLLSGEFRLGSVELDGDEESETSHVYLVVT